MVYAGVHPALRVEIVLSGRYLRKIVVMTRGNQREQAREKNLKKQQGQKQSGLPEGMTLAQKKILDAEIMRQKQLKALEAAKETKK